MSSIQSITESFKGLSVEELLAIITAASAEAKKAAKVVAKAPKEAKEKKGSMPKGVVPPQLRKPRAWVDFTLDHANTNGWESFEVKGQTEPMAASVLLDGKYVFEATGKPMNNKQAMSLSKVRWDRKEGKGTREDLYKEFEAGYVEIEVAAAPVAEEVAAAAASEVAAPKPKKAAAPKKSEEEKKAEKEAAALKKAQEKETEKLRKEAEKLAAKEVAAAAKAVTPKAKKVAKKTEEKEEVVPPFEFEDDGFAHPWDFKGKKFLRDFEGNMWFRKEDGESAGWAGKYDPATKSIDASAEEPEYEDEE